MDQRAKVKSLKEREINGGYNGVEGKRRRKMVGKIYIKGRERTGREKVGEKRA